MDQYGLENINPFDILSGKVVKNHYGTFWFKEPMSTGDNLDKNGFPIEARLHRDGDLPAAIWNKRNKDLFDDFEECEVGPAYEWVVNGQSHRKNGPAIIWDDGSMSYYIKGKLHREDGPAIVGTNGLEDEYYLYGKFITKEQYEEEVKWFGE